MTTPTSTPPSGFQVMRLLARVTWQRMINQMALGMGALSPKEKPPESGSRQTPKSGGFARSLMVFMFFVGFCIFCMSGLEGCLVVERLNKRLDPKQLEASATEETRALANFKQESSDKLLTTGKVWLEAPHDQPLMVALGLVLFAACLGQLALMLGASKQDLGRADWDMEWLFCFPVQARTLFLIRVIQAAVVGPVQVIFWLVWAPWLAGVYWCAGYGWWSLPLSFALTTCVSFVLASLALVIETWLQKHVGPASRKNIQAVCLLMGSLLGMATLAILLAPTLDPLLVVLARWIPAAFLYNPFSLPVLLGGSGWVPLVAGSALPLVGLVMSLGAVRLASWLVRDGLVASSGASLGSRNAQPQPTASVGQGWFGGLFQGIIAKEMLLLMRDRAFLVQTLGTPAVLAAFYYMIYGDAIISLLQYPRSAAAIAFGVGSYALFFSAGLVLATESSALWLLWSFPRRLHVMLLQKTVLWAFFSALYALVVLGIAAAVGMPLNTDALILGTVSVGGVGLFAFLAAALGILGTSTATPGVKSRPGTGPMMLFGLLASVYVTCISLPWVWVMIPVVVGFAALAVMLWRRVRERVPYLLDQ